MLFFKNHPSPTNLFAVAEELAVVGGGGVGDEPRGSVSALRDGAARGVTAHFGTDPAGAHAVDEDATGVQGNVELARDGVHRRLGYAIERRPGGDTTAELPSPAGHVDDAATLTHERQHGLRGPERAERVCVEGTDGHVDRRVEDADFAIEENTGVIHEGVEVVDMSSQRFVRSFDARGVGDVDLEEGDVEPILAQGGSGGFSSIKATGTKEHAKAAFSELTSNLKADTFVGTGD